MPEGDTVLAAANRLHKVLAGHKLTRADLNWPTAPPHALLGREVLEVGAYGKHMLMRLAGGLTLHTHLRMDGQWRVVETGSVQSRTRGAHVRAVLATPSWTCIGSRLGLLEVLPTDHEPELLGYLGPDILADTFLPPHRVAQIRADPGGFLAPRLSHSGLGMVAQEVGAKGWLTALENFAAQPQDRPIGETLLDQTVVAGVGTIFMAEGLFKHRISPWSPLKQVDLPRLLASIRTHLIRGVVVPAAGRIIHVHSRTGQPCHRCGTLIKQGIVGPPLRERPAYYCPVCQK